VTYKTIEEIKDTVKDARGLREMLFDEIDKLRSHTRTVKEAMAIARLADNIINSVRIELEAYKHPLSDAFVRLPESPVFEIDSLKK